MILAGDATRARAVAEERGHYLALSRPWATAVHVPNPDDPSRPLCPEMDDRPADWAACDIASLPPDWADRICHNCIREIRGTSVLHDEIIPDHRAVTAAEAVEIREFYRDHRRRPVPSAYVDIAEDYDASAATIGQVVRGEIWPDAGGPIKGEDYDTGGESA